MEGRERLGRTTVAGAAAQNPYLPRWAMGRCSREGELVGATAVRLGLCVSHVVECMEHRSRQ